VRLQTAGGSRRDCGADGEARRPHCDGRDRRQPAKGHGRGAPAADVPPRESETSGRILLATDLAGVALILVLATVMTARPTLTPRVARIRSPQPRPPRGAGGCVAERTEHLVKAHEDLRHSTEVMQSTFPSMAEAVLVIDTKGPGAARQTRPRKRMLRYKPGMTVSCCGR